MEPSGNNEAPTVNFLLPATFSQGRNSQVRSCPIVNCDGQFVFLTDTWI
jgi:hypothetical protein